jgi:hypothetical protein
MESIIACPVEPVESYKDRTLTGLHTSTHHFQVGADQCQLQTDDSPAGGAKQPVKSFPFWQLTGHLRRR